MGSNGDSPPRVIIGTDGRAIQARPDPIEAHRVVCPICRRRARLRGAKVAKAARALAYAEESHLMECQRCAELTASEQPFALCPKMHELTRLRLETVGRIYCPRGRELLRAYALEQGLIAPDEDPPGPADLEQAVDDVEDDVESGLD